MDLLIIRKIYGLTYYTTQYRVSKCGRTARAIVLLHHIHLDPRRVCNHTKTGKKEKDCF